MIFHYVCRDVAPGAVCSYPVGRTLCYEGGCRTEQEAQQRADKYNRHCHCPGVNYVVVSARDDVPLEFDHREPWIPCPYERILVG